MTWLGSVFFVNATKRKWFNLYQINNNIVIKLLSEYVNSIKVL